MNKRNALATFDFFRVLWDVLCIVGAYAASVVVYTLTIGRWVGVNYLWMGFVYVLIFVLAMFVMRMYNITTFYYLDRMLMRVMSASALSAVSIAMMVFMLQLTTVSRYFYVMFCLSSMGVVLCQRIIHRKLKSRKSKEKMTRVLFVGDKEIYAKFKSYTDKTALNQNFIANLMASSPLINTPERFEQYIINNQVDEVAIVYQNEMDFDYKEYMSVCEDMGITVRLVMDMVEMPTAQRYVNSVGTYPVLTYHSVSMNQAQIFFKSLFDVVAATLGVVLLSPVFLLTALAIKLESKGPVFFCQKRVGQNGKVFEIVKFRSMYMDAEERKKELMAQNKIKDGMMFKMDNDPRVTKVGKFIRKTSIDELPQLINVIKREMSLVGTRPPTVDEVKKYERGHRRRISIRPGITGIWQVSGRSNIVDFETVVKMDKEYIDKWSFGLDIKLLFKTVAVVFTNKGAC